MTANDSISTRPLVSIAMPVYNGAEYFRLALDAILAQDYENFEVVIVDNASTDNTPQICAEYEARDARIRYHRNTKNLGAIRNWNRSVELVQGEYLLWAPDHDLWDKTCVSKCAAILEADPSLVLCYPGAAWMNQEGDFVEDIPALINTKGMDKLARLQVVMWGIGNCYPVHGMWRLSALRRSKLFTNTVGPDAILLVEMSLLGGFTYVPEKLFYLRKMPYDGDMDKFLERLLKRAPSRSAALRLYWEFVRTYLIVVNRQTKNPIGKALLLPAALFCVLSRYGWVLKGLLAAGNKSR